MGSIKISFTCSEEDLKSKLKSIAFIPTDFPEPVVPATSKWGIRVRSTTIGIPDMSCPRRTVIIPKKRGKTEDPLRMRKIAAQGFQSEQLGEEQIKNMHPIQGGRKKKTRKKNKLSLSDYRKILKFYKMKIPKSASKIRKEGNKIIAKKFCSCIKKVRKKFKKEGIAIGICTKSVITRKGIKRGKFKCKKRRTIKLYKGGSKRSKKNTRNKRGGDGEKGSLCAICYESTETNYQFCKNHYFCLKCLQKYIKTGNEKCPLCRGAFWKPERLEQILHEDLVISRRRLREKEENLRANGKWSQFDGYDFAYGQRFGVPRRQFKYGACCTDCKHNIPCIGRLCDMKKWCYKCKYDAQGFATPSDWDYAECTKNRSSRGGGGTQSKVTDTIENKSHGFDIIVDLYPENFYGEQFMVTKGGECHYALGVMQGLFKNKYPAVASTREDLSLEHLNKTASKPENFLNQMKAGGEVDEYFRKFFHNVEDNVMYLISMNTSDHSFTIEINGEYMRIISLYGTWHGFKEYHEQSRFGKYFKIGGEVYLEMMENFRKINNFAIKNEMYLGNTMEMVFVNNDGEEKFNAAIDAHTDLFGYGEGVTRNDYIDIYRRSAPHGRRSMGYQTYDRVNLDFGREYKYTIDEKMQQGGHLRPLISHPHDDEEYGGGKKSKKIKDIINIFKQYPDIFPRGYFRYLPATLEKHDKKGTLIYKNGVVLTYTKYKKTVNKYKKYKIKPGDVKLNQLVNKNQGNGEAKKIFLKFMKTHKGSNLLLDVLASNKRAIKFYRKNGFKKIADTKFGDKLKGIVMLKKSKKNKTRKKKN